MINLPIGKVFEAVIDWLTDNLDPVFDAISFILTQLIEAFEAGLLFVPSIILIILLAALAWWIAGRGVGLFTLIGMFVVDGMGIWDQTMATLALAPIRSAPALNMANATSRVRMPPLAFTCMVCPTTWRIRRTSSACAPG